MDRAEGEMKEDGGRGVLFRGRAAVKCHRGDGRNDREDC